MYGFLANDGLSFVDTIGLAPGDPYKTQDLAAKEASNDAWNMTQQSGIEHCGWIVTIGGAEEDGGAECFTYSEPVNNIEDSDWWQRGQQRAMELNWTDEMLDERLKKEKKKACYPGKKPEGAVAMYHSHGPLDPANVSAEEFSKADFDEFDKVGVDGYVATPRGAFGRYDHDMTPPDQGLHDERLGKVDYYNPETGGWEPRPPNPVTAPSYPTVFPLQ